MKLDRSKRGLATLSASALLAATTFGNSSYVVDDDGSLGVDFTDIAPSIAGAQDGDVLLVMPGGYGAFTLDKGLTILGQLTATVTGTATVAGVSAPARATIVRLAPVDLAIINCSGAVVVQEMQGLQTIRVLASNDVRLRDVAAEATALNSPTDTAILTTSRVEIVHSTLAGWDGYAHANCECKLNGGAGLLCQTSARVHLALSSGQGGSGNWTNSVQSGNGRAAVWVDSTSEAILVGPGAFVGGNAGETGVSCLGNGIPAAAVVHIGGSGLLRVSAATFTGGTGYYQSACHFTQALGILGPYEQAVPDDPTLSLAGDPGPGQQITATLRGPPGDQARIWLGRHMIVQTDPAIAIELLVDQQRIIQLGSIPANGQKSLNLTIPASYAPGVTFGLQADCTLPSGEVRRTNSLPIIVR